MKYYYLHSLNSRTSAFFHIILWLTVEMWTKTDMKKAFSTAEFRVLTCFSKGHLDCNCSFMW